MDDIFVAEADAAFAAAAGNAVAVAGAAVDADAVAGVVAVEAHEPVAVGRYGAAAVAEVMMPIGGVDNLADHEWSAVDAFWGAAVALAHFVAAVGAKADGVGSDEADAGAAAFEDEEGAVGFGDVDVKAVATESLVLDGAVDDRRVYLIEELGGAFRLKRLITHHLRRDGERQNGGNNEGEKFQIYQFLIFALLIPSSCQ